MLDDSDPGFNALAETVYANLVSKNLYSRWGCGADSKCFQRCFGGADLRTVYLGSLGGDRLASFRSEIAGHQLAHWLFGFEVARG